MKNGFIYLIFNNIIEGIKLISLVEYFKKAVDFLNLKDNELKRTYSRNVVDLFILLKWIFVIIVISFSFSNCYITLIIWYLIFTNSYSYFYYHIWQDDIFEDLDRSRRRFIHLMLAIGFSNICFAYLYYLPYSDQFTWTTNKSILNSIWFSISNSLASSYDVVKPLEKSEFIYAVSKIQLIITFIFFTIILSKSIPQNPNKK